MKRILILNGISAFLAFSILVMGVVGFAFVNHKENLMVQDHRKLLEKLSTMPGAELPKAILEARGTQSLIFVYAAKSLSCICVSFGMGILILNGSAIVMARRSVQK